MAIVKTIKNGFGLNNILMEDPIPGSPYLYIQNDAYDKNTLTPQYDVALSHSVYGNSLSAFGMCGNFSYCYNGTTKGGVLLLAGETTHVQQNPGYFGAYNSNSNNGHTTNLDMAPFASMDPTNTVAPAKYFTNGVNNEVLWNFRYSRAAYNNDFTTCFEGKINTTSSDLAKGLTVNFNNYHGAPGNTTFVNYGGVGNAGYQGLVAIPVYYNPTTTNIICVPHSIGNSGGSNSAQNGYNYIPAAIFGGAYMTSYTPTPSLQYTQAYMNSNNMTVQFLGVAADGNAVFFWNNVSNDYQQYIGKYYDNNNTTVAYGSANNLYTTVPSAAGGSIYAGYRAGNFGNFIPKFASKTFTDTLSANCKGWYVPYVDTVGNFLPFYYRWASATDLITRQNSVSANYPNGTNINTFWQYDTFSGSSVLNSWGLQRCWYNETNVYNGVRYLHFFQLHEAGGVFDNNPLMRAVLVYSIDPGNPGSLTYSSSIVPPQTIKNICWLTSDRTVIALIGTTATYIYTFTGTWNLTSTLNYSYCAIGTDNLGRIWAVDAGPFGYGRLHLISLFIPANIVVTPDNTTQNYTGTNISGNLSAAAYNQSGGYIATTIKLVLEGGSMVFAGNNLTTTVTTLSTGPVLVPYTITGPGYSNIVASIAI